MKMNYILFVLLSLFTVANAQIPNGDFELWMDFDDYEDPFGWYTPNALYGGDPELVRTGDPYNGIYGARLENQEDDNNNIVRAMMLSGSNPESPGFPYDKRPVALQGFFEYKPKDGDSCSIKVSLWRFNIALQERELIGAGVFASGDEVEPYIHFSIPINYVSTLFPDTAVIEVYAGRENAFAEDSRLTIDELQFVDNSTAVHSVQSSLLTLYPNPVKDYFVLSGLATAIKIQIEDLNGMVVKTILLNASEQNPRIELTDMHGVFFVKVLDLNGSIIAREKILVID